jgi:hypothetical protein
MRTGCRRRSRRRPRRWPPRGRDWTELPVAKVHGWDPVAAQIAGPAVTRKLGCETAGRSRPVHPWRVMSPPEPSRQDAAIGAAGRGCRLLVPWSGPGRAQGARAGQAPYGVVQNGKVGRMAVRKAAHPSIDECNAKGVGARDLAPPSSHAKWRPAADRPDPVTLLAEQDTTREPGLVPVRHGRTASPHNQPGRRTGSAPVGAVRAIRRRTPGSIPQPSSSRTSRRR